MPEDRSRVLALVFTDLANSTGLKAAKGERVAGELIRRRITSRTA